MRVRVDLTQMLNAGMRAQTISQVMHQELIRAVEGASALAQAEAAQTAPVHTGELRGAIRARPPVIRRQGRDGILVRANVAIVGRAGLHGTVMELGRRAGAKIPPFGRIRRWVHLKVRRGHMDVSWASGKTVAKRKDAAAWVIARSIAKKGIKPRRFMEKAAKKVEPVFRALVDLAIGRSLRGLQRGP